MLNFAHGFVGPSLDFLRPWPLAELHVLLPPMKDLSPIRRLRESLKGLQLEIFPTGEGAIDIEGFLRLEELAISWTMIQEQVSSITTIEHLYLDRYSSQDLVPLAPLVSLRNLQMKGGPKLESLHGLRAFSRLVRLAVHGASLLADDSALQGSPAATTLTELQLESCRKLSNIENVSLALNLEILNMGDCGDIESLSPLRRMRNLQSLSLYESTRIVDGDLSPVLDLPKLTDFRIASRRNYNPSVTDIQRLLKDRTS
ncbi:hypothetical protein ACFRJ9_01760 [Paenarthrobacter sp. NPDC056912]|uniref:hypothetical protein n=1 Tax=Paenarthrobacter sp. NPDC056912 TaxID=3345965 RepID=UPI00366DE715